MSELEPGCKAMIITGMNIENIGKIVTVGVFIGKINGYNGDDFWEVDREIVFHYEHGNGKGVCFVSHEKDMRRLDDHDTENYFESKKELTTTF